MLKALLVRLGKTSSLAFGEPGSKIKKIVVWFFDVLILSGDIEPGKSSCLSHIASYPPSGKISQNILARL